VGSPIACAVLRAAQVATGQLSWAAADFQELQLVLRSLPNLAHDAGVIGILQKGQF